MGARATPVLVGSRQIFLSFFFLGCCCWVYLMQGLGCVDLVSETLAVFFLRFFFFCIGSDRFVCCRCRLDP